MKLMKTLPHDVKFLDDASPDATSVTIEQETLKRTFGGRCTSCNSKAEGFVQIAIVLPSLKSVLSIVLMQRNLFVSIGW